MTLTERYAEAAAFAIATHRGDVRKGTDIPYVAHLLAVSALVLEDGGGEDEAIGALLHDCAEDHGGETMLAEIERRFGAAVREIVAGCSDAIVDDPAQKGPWRERKEAYIGHLETAPPAVLRVSNADKVHNARAILADYREIGDELWKRFSVGAEGQLWYYRSLADAFLRLRSGRLPRELDETVAELELLVSE